MSILSNKANQLLSEGNKCRWVSGGFIHFEQTGKRAILINKSVINDLSTIVTLMHELGHLVEDSFGDRWVVSGVARSTEVMSSLYGIRAGMEAVVAGFSEVGKEQIFRNTRLFSWIVNGSTSPYYEVVLKTDYSRLRAQVIDLLKKIRAIEDKYDLYGEYSSYTGGYIGRMERDGRVIEVNDDEGLTVQFLSLNYLERRLEILEYEKRLADGMR